MDTIRVAFPVADRGYANFPHQRIVESVDETTGEVSRRPDRAHCRLDDGLVVWVSRDLGSASGWFEFSCPRRLRGTNSTLCTVDQVITLLENVLGMITAKGLTQPIPVEHLAIRRLDYARDFAPVFHVGSMLQAFVRLATPWAKMDPELRWSESAAEFDSLRKGTPNSYIASLYNKTVEMKRPYRTGDAATLRFEISLRRANLSHRTTPLVTVGDLISVGDDGLREVGQGYFARCGYDRRVRGTHRALEVIRDRQPTMSDGEIKAIPHVLGLLACIASDLPYGRNPATRRKYLAFANDWGLSVADFAAPGTHDLRLDFHDGKQHIA